MRIQLPGHRSFLEPATTAAGTSAGTSAPGSSAHPRGSSSSSAVASLNNGGTGGGGVMLEEFSIVPDFADAASTQTPLATERDRERMALPAFGQATPRELPQLDPASMLTPAISSAVLSPPMALATPATAALDGGSVSANASAGAEPAPGDHVQPSGDIGPNEVTRLSSVVAKGGRHALIKQKSVAGSSEISISRIESIEQPDECEAIPAGAASSAAASALGSTKDILRITAKEVQRGGGNGGLFSSSMEWETLVDARNPFNLRFVHDEELEAQFQADFFRRFLDPNRRGHLLAGRLAAARARAHCVLVYASLFVSRSSA